MEAMAVTNQELRREVARLQAVEEALSESEKRFRQVAESAGEFIWEIDVEGLYKYASPSVEQILGYTPDELVGKKHFYDLFVPTLQHELKAAAFQVFADRRTFRNFPNPNVTKSGTIVHLETSGAPMLDLAGNLVGYCGADTDVTELVETERALRESGERLRQAAEAAEFGVYQYDLTNGETYYSPEFLGLYGLSADAVLELDANKVPKAVHPDDKAGFLSRARASCDPHGPGIFEAEYRILRPDGQVRWLRARGRTLFAGQGRDCRPLLANGIIQDITARKQSEQEIAQQRHELAHLSRVNLLGELTGSIAHELNQPLTAILSNAQAAQHFLANGRADLNEMRDILADIVSEDKRASEVIRRVRAMLQKTAVPHQPLDVNEIVQEVLKLMHSDLVHQGVTVHAELVPELPVLHADRVQLQQVLLNLGMNACDAMSGAARGDRRLTIRTGMTGDHSVLISVVDCGTGIAPENLEQLFEPFFTTKPHGLGLGLTICRTIITSHGGKLWAENNPARGATFHFVLPAGGAAPIQQ